MNIYQLPNPSDFESNIDGKNTHLFTLKNRAGMQIAMTDYGARLVSALVPDNKGNLVDVVLGFNSIDKYLNAQEKYHGATIGRFCNRIANSKFTFEGKQYTLSNNNNNNTLHGGPNGFHTKIWDRQISGTNRIDFYYVSPDGEEGFPGEVKINVSYELTNNNEIIIKFRASTNKPTILNLTNHAYFNLNGEGNNDILDHYLRINADHILEINKNQIPTGNTIKVENSAFDFKTPKKIGENIKSNDEQIHIANGYDHSYVIENNNPAAIAHSPNTGIELEVFTDLPTIHLYTGNFLSSDNGKSGKNYTKNGGFCLEAQHYLDFQNQDKFPKVCLTPNIEYTASIIYKFNILK